ncbi:MULTISPECIES: hypothetical protein [unclassified Sphingomonas]|uniref:hypothetical protein n=1 Tax=unclassified Sphingomonas TaxID=196159 RepID=UPI001F5630BE|nr:MULTISPECIES: hypothetical protein [unclassified Sphingomonas]
MATTPGSETGANAQADANEKINAAAGAAKEAASSARDEAQKLTSGAAQLFKDGTDKLGKEVVDRAKSYAEDGKARAGTALDEIVQMINDAAGTVDDKLGSQYGQYARTAADKVQGFSEGLKAKQLDDLIEDARGFVQKSPAVAIGTAAALGFVLVRLIQSGLAADSDTKA